MELIDTHAHLTYPGIVERLDEVLNSALAVGVNRIISVSTSIADAAAGLAIARRHPQVSCALGIHPHEAGKAAPEDLDRLAVLLHEPQVVAAGEMGLDYHYDFADRATQRGVFERQLAIAAAADLPVIIHCREALDDVIAVLRNAGFERRRVVFHCFGGSESEASRIAEWGWRLSFTGVITFRRSTEVQAVVRSHLLDQIMLETDSPYLSPEPVRKIRINEPAHVAHIARFIANLRGIDDDEVATKSTEAARSFFGLP